MQRFFKRHKEAWRKKNVQRYHTNVFRDCHSLQKLPNSIPAINWIYGFAHKFRMPLTAFDFEIPKVDAAKILRHPAVDRLFDLEHRDPDVRET